MEDLRPVPRPPATLEDVARRAGVSKYTVSAVLNQTRSNTRVSASTRDRIVTIASELSYRPNALAQSLRNRRTHLIGFYNGYGYFDARNRFLSELLGGLQEGCCLHEKDLILYRILQNTPPDAIYDQLIDGRVEGVVLFAPTNDALADRLSQTAVPVVAIADPLPQLPSVFVDEFRGGALQVEHLVDRGHRRVLYRANPYPTPSVQRRYDSFCLHAAEAGIEVLTGLPIGSTHALSPMETEILTRTDNLRVTAAVCWEDNHADHLLRACQSLGRHAPDDLAVIGFDHLPLDREQFWDITTVHAPWADVGKRAIELVSAAVSGEVIPRETILPVELYIGNTT